MTRRRPNALWLVSLCLNMPRFTMPAGFGRYDDAREPRGFFIFMSRFRASPRHDAAELRAFVPAMP